MVLPKIPNLVLRIHNLQKLKKFNSIFCFVYIQKNQNCKAFNKNDGLIPI